MVFRSFRQRRLPLMGEQRHAAQGYFQQEPRGLTIRYSSQYCFPVWAESNAPRLNRIPPGQPRESGACRIRWLGKLHVERPASRSSRRNTFMFSMNSAKPLNDRPAQTGKTRIFARFFPIRLKSPRQNGLQTKKFRIIAKSVQTMVFRSFRQRRLPLMGEQRHAAQGYFQQEPRGLTIRYSSQYCFPVWAESNAPRLNRIPPGQPRESGACRIRWLGKLHVERPASRSSRRNTFMFSMGIS